MSAIKRCGTFLRSNTIVPIFLAVFVGCSILIGGFFSGNNFINILNQVAAKCVLATGMTFLIINGHFDLSVGTLMGMTSCLLVGLMPNIGVFASIVLVLAIGVAAGLLNGFLVMKCGINTFIVTLVTMMIFRALGFIYTDTSIGGKVESFFEFGRVKFLGLTTLVWIAILLLAVGFLILSLTRHGRNTYAVGGNQSAAINMGINAARTTILNFMICSVCAVIAGIMYASKLNSASPTLGYPDAHMIAISSVVLGGTKLAGGYGNMAYTAIGVVTLGIIDNAMNLLGLSSYYNTLVSGIILIAVLYLDKIIKRD